MKINEFSRLLLTNTFLARIVQMRKYFLTMSTKKIHKEINIKQMSCYGQEKGRSLLPKCSSVAKMFLSDVYKKGTQAKRHLANELQCGRSMVEMLGVLAIIGVLSIGGITGYINAMEKQTLNKYSTDLSLMVMNLKVLQADQNKTAIANKLFVPESLFNNYDKYKNSTTFTDKYGNAWGNNTSGLYVRIGNSVESKARETAIKKTCPIIIQTAKDMQIKKLSLNHQKGSATICDEKNCKYKFNELTIEKINEFCDIILKAQNADAIMYF